MIINKKFTTFIGDSMLVSFRLCNYVASVQRIKAYASTALYATAGIKRYFDQ